MEFPVVPDNLVSLDDQLLDLDDQHGSLEECAWSQEDLCCLGEGAIWVARCTEGDQKIVGLCRCREDFPMIV
jgi:hypothetical protein